MEAKYNLQFFTSRCVKTTRRRASEAAGAGRKHHCDFAFFSECILHIHPLGFVYVNVAVNLPDEAVTPTAPLCLLCGRTQNQMHHYQSGIMEISGDLLGVLQQQSAICTKDRSEQSVAGSEDIFSETGPMPETLCAGSVLSFTTAVHQAIHLLLLTGQGGEEEEEDIRYQKVKTAEHKKGRSERAFSLVWCVFHVSLMGRPNQTRIHILSVKTFRRDIKGVRFR